MSARHKSAVLVSRDEIVAAPLQRCCEDRTFELPPGLHVATALLFVGFVSVLSFAFRAPAMAVPFGIFIIFIAGFFTLPAIWVRMKPEENHSRALRWSELGAKGVGTPDGRTSGREAAILVLLLPTVIFCWAIAVALVAALN
jgi:hypothetical protein